MTTEKSTQKKTVQFPPLDNASADKVEGLLKTMSEWMEFEYQVKEVRAIAVEFDAERSDVAQMLQRIAAAKKPKPTPRVKSERP